jgi:hypothetical protein
MDISGKTAKVLATAVRQFDIYLDNAGVPVAFRKYYIEDWLNRAKDLNTPDDIDATLLREVVIAIETAGWNNFDSTASWYYDTYGEQSMTPPALSFVVAYVPFPAQIRVGLPSQELLLPKTNVCWGRVKEAVQKAADKKPYLFEGLRALRAFPQTPWIALAQAEYDASVSSFFLPRPSYGHVLWHSLQTLEKSFKAVFRAHGWSEARLQGEIEHSLIQAATKLTELGHPLPTAAEKLLHRVMSWASVDSRYAEDSTAEQRVTLRKQALQVHHLVLEVLAVCGPTIRGGIMAGSCTTALHRGWARDHQSFSTKVYDSYVEWAHSGEMPYPTGGPGVHPRGLL